MLDWLRLKEQELAKSLLSERERNALHNGIDRFCARISAHIDSTFPGPYYITFRSGDSLYYLFSYTQGRVERVSRVVMRHGGLFYVGTIGSTFEVVDFSADRDLSDRPAQGIGWEILSVL